MPNRSVSEPAGAGARGVWRLVVAALLSILLLGTSTLIVGIERRGAGDALAEAQRLNSFARKVRTYEFAAELAAVSPARWSAARASLDPQLAQLRVVAPAAGPQRGSAFDLAMRDLIAADGRLDALASGTGAGWAAPAEQFAEAELRLRAAVGDEQGRRLDTVEDALSRSDALARYTQAGTLLLLLLFALVMVLLDRRAVQRRLGIIRASEQRLQDVLDQSPTAVYLANLDGHYTLVNRAWEAATGRARADLLGRPADDIWPAAVAADSRSRRREVARTGRTVEHLVVGPAGAGRTFLESTFALQDLEGHVYGVGGVATDITEQVRAQERERLLAAVVMSSSDAILTLRHGVITSCNGAAEKMLAGSGALVGNSLLDLVSGPGAALLQEVLVAGSEQPLEGREMQLETRQADTLAVVVTVTPLGEQQANTVSVLLRDIGQAERHRAELTRQARVDRLTGLANRLALQERLTAATADSVASGALLFVDLDHFKLVNDTFGHSVGDALLREVAQRLTADLGPESFLARLGGDEFALLHLGELNSGTGVALADRVRGVIAGSVELPEVGMLSVTASVGVCLAPAQDAEAWLQEADIAMYAAKRAGRNRSILFTPAEGRAAVAQQQLRLDLQHAAESGELVLHYQPVVDLESGQPTGLEALVRWHHPERGLLSPDLFIPLAEDSGAISDIGAFVWAESVRQLLEWDSEATYELRLAVNVSVRQLRDDRFLTAVAGDFQRFPQLRGRLMVEITESALAEKALLPTLLQLKQAGALLAIDDFGTGYSALSYLSQFPIDCLKIDSSFIEGLSASAGGYAVLRTVVQLAETLGMTTIAEGIEDESTAGLLAAAGCRSAQGFWWSRPVPAEQVLPTIERLVHEPLAARVASETRERRGQRSSADPDVVARAVQLSVAGASTHTIAAILNKEGVRTTTGRRWLAASVTALLSGHHRTDSITRRRG